MMLHFVGVCQYLPTKYIVRKLTIFNRYLFCASVSCGAIRGEKTWLSKLTFAAHMGMPVQRLNEIVRGKRGITAEAAWLFSGAFKTSPEFWLNLQTAYDLSHNRPSPPIGPLVLN